MQKYVVFGASPNPIRHSFKAVKSLLRRNQEVVPIGFRKGVISGLPIQKGLPDLNGVGTLLLYVGKKRQAEFYDYILNLSPQKIVFNPGTENPELQKMAEDKDIEVINDCALVLINGGQI